MAPRRIAFINEKGGSCKTTLTMNMAGYLALYKGKKVLVVDMDPQGHAGKSLGINVRASERTIGELLSGMIGAQEAITQSRIRNLDLIVANKRFGDFALNLRPDGDNYTLLRDALAGQVDKYDYVFFDSPPSLGWHTINIMLAARYIVVPVSLTYLALDGCAEILDSVRRVREEFGRGDLEIALVVPTLYRNTNLADAIVDKLHEYFPGKVSGALIGFSVAIDEAQSHGQTIWEYAPSSHGAEQLRILAKEVAKI